MKELSLPVIVTKKINPRNGQFLKGHKPHNKGKKWSEWMDGRKKRKVLRALEKGHKGNPNLAGSNAIPIVGIKDGKFKVYPSSVVAGKVLGIQPRNIRHVCAGNRKKAGGYMWFYESSNEWLGLIK